MKQNKWKLSIAIFSLLCLIFLILPMLNSIQKKAMAAKCESNLQQIQKAIKFYNIDYGRSVRYPQFDNPGLFVTLYKLKLITDLSILRCPGSGNSPATKEDIAVGKKDITDYACLAGWDKYNRYCDYTKMLIWDKENYHKKRNVLWARVGCKGGSNANHVDSCEEKEFQYQREIDDKLALACDKNTSKEVLTSLALCPNDDVKTMVAMHPKTPLIIVLTLFRDLPVWQKYPILRNPNPIVRQMAEVFDYGDDTEPYLKAISKSKKVSKLLAKLKAAKNSNDSKVLEHLANDQNPIVKAFVASNSHTSANVLLKLAKNQDNKIKTLVAKNPNVSNTILSQLVKENNRSINYVIANNKVTNSAILEKLADNEDINIRASIAKNPNISRAVFDKLAKENNITIKYAIIENPLTEVKTLIKLSTDPNCMVRKAVIYNPNVPIKILEKLAQDHDKCVSSDAKAMLLQIKKDSKKLSF